MIKKMMLLAMAVGALVAFAVPASAMAAPLVHDEKEEAVETVEAISENTVSKTELGTLECATVRLDLTLTEDSETTAQGSGSGTANGVPGELPHGVDCRTSNIGPVAIERVAVNSIDLGATGGSASFEFDLKITANGFTCTVDSTGAAITYNSPTNLHVAGTLVGTAGCPNGSIAGDFAVQNGVTVG